jgi:hypothetical protein
MKNIRGYLRIRIWYKRNNFSSIAQIKVLNTEENVIGHILWDPIVDQVESRVSSPLEINMKL